MANIHRILVVGIVLLTTGAAVADPVPLIDTIGDPLPPFALARNGSARWRQGGMIDALAVSADGTRIASHGVGDGVRVWDAKTGKLVRQFPAQPWGAHALAFSPDGKQLAIATQVLATGERNRASNQFGTFICWDLETGGERERCGCGPAIQPGERTRNAMTWTEAGPVIAETDGRPVCPIVYIYHPGSGQSSRRTPLIRIASVAALAFCPGCDDPWILRNDGTIRVIEENKDRRFVSPMEPKTEHEYSSSLIAITHDKKTIALTLPDNSLALIDTETRKERKRFTDEIAPATAVAFTPDGKTLVTGSMSPCPGVRLWDVETGRERFAEDKVAPPLTGLALSPDGHTFVVTDASKTLRIGDATFGRQLSRFSNADARGPVFSPDGKLLAFVQNDSRIVVRDFTDRTPGTERCRIDVGTKVNALAFAQGEALLAAACADGTARVFDAAGKPGRVFNTAGKEVLGGTFSSDGQFLVTTAAVEREGANPRRPLQRPEVQIWDAVAGTAFALDARIVRSAHTVVFHPRERTLISLHLSRAADDVIDPFVDYKFGVRHSLDDRTESIRMWRLNADGEPSSFENSVQRERAVASSGFSTWSPPHALAFAPDGDTVAVAVDREIVIYETASGLVRFRVNGHLGNVTGLAFAPDGRTLVSCAADGLVMTWDATGLRSPGRLPGGAAEWWNALAGPDAGRAIWCLADAPEKALPLMRERLKPIDGSKFPEWIANLDHAKFVEREAAQQKLEWAGIAASSALVNSLKRDSRPEGRRRIELLLSRIGERKPSQAEHRALAAVAVLRRIGTQEARSILKDAARGDEAAYLTKAARAALQ